jgi:hypothetical protein
MRTEGPQVRSNSVAFALTPVATLTETEAQNLVPRAEVEKRDDQICLAFYRDTFFHGQELAGCIDTNVCYYVADDGHGTSFELSSIKMTRLGRQGSGAQSVCAFYKNWDCIGQREFILDSEEDAPDLNSFGSFHQNFNDQINSYKCYWLR